MKLIPLTRGKSAIVDDADFVWLSQRTWTLSGNLGNHYASTWVPIKKTQRLMHREIMNPPSGIEVDHINGDHLDNRRMNLRLCSRSENGKNRKKCATKTTSVYKGVSWNKSRMKWYSHIKHNGKSIHLGSFREEIDAAMAYNKAAIEYFGDFAAVNLLAKAAKLNDTKSKGVINAPSDTQKGDPHGPAL